MTFCRQLPSCGHTKPEFNLHVTALQRVAVGPQNAFTEAKQHPAAEALIESAANFRPGKLERYQCMATCDQASDLLLRIAYPTPVRPGLGNDPRSAALRAERLPVLSNPQAKELGDIFYLIESRPQNPWAAIASFAIMSVLLLGIVVIPLFHIETLPKRETLTMLYAPAPP